MIADRSIAMQLASPRLSRPILHAAQIELRSGEVDRAPLVTYRDAHCLHGALHAALGVGHSGVTAEWSIQLPAPRDPRLWVITPRAEILDAIPAELTSFAPPPSLNEFTPRARSFWQPAPHRCRIAARARVLAPRPRDAGTYRVRVLTRTPIVLRQSLSGAARAAGASRAPLDAPTCIAGPLAHTALWLGLMTPASAIVADVTSFDLERVLDEDDEEGVIVGGHWRSGDHTGRIIGHGGWLEVECNAVGRWLLDCAARIGLGGKTTLGFGRIQVIDR